MTSSESLVTRCRSLIPPCSSPAAQAVSYLCPFISGALATTAPAAAGTTVDDASGVSLPETALFDELSANNRPKGRVLPAAVFGLQ